MDMGKIITSTVAAIALLVIPAGNVAALELEGVKVAETVEIAGAQVALNGAGVRTKFIFDVYVGSLYLTTKTDQQAVAINADEPKRIDMDFVRDVAAKKIVDAFREGFEKNTPEMDEPLKEKVEKFLSWFSAELEEGHTVSLTYTPGAGTAVVINGVGAGTVEGVDFMKALWAIWLGDHPADKDLKKGMLGAK